jgi:hypothetical protein
LLRPLRRSTPETGFVPANGLPLAVQLLASSLRQLSSTDARGNARSVLARSVTLGVGNALIVRR